jgi:hypothetical protein
MLVSPRLEHPRDNAPAPRTGPVDDPPALDPLIG